MRASICDQSDYLGVQLFKHHFLLLQVQSVLIPIQSIITNFSLVGAYTIFVFLEFYNIFFEQKKIQILLLTSLLHYANFVA